MWRKNNGEKPSPLRFKMLLQNLQKYVNNGITEENGNFIAQYLYDEWGNLLYIDSDDRDDTAVHLTVAEANPLRYRGYYYDAETGYYYLQSRYYDSEICRFINADAVEIALLSKNTNAGTNLSAYCNNNPVNNSDRNGFITKDEAKSQINNFIKKHLIKIWPDLNNDYTWEMKEIYRETSGNYTAKIKYYKFVLFKNSFNITVGDYNSWKEDGEVIGQLNKEFVNNQHNYMISENKKGLSVSFTDDGPNLLGIIFASVLVLIHMIISWFNARSSVSKYEKANNITKLWDYMFEVTNGNSKINGCYILYKGDYKKI